MSRRFMLTALSLCIATVTLAQSTITVLSYNINHGANPKGRNNLIRIGQLIRQYKPDLVAIQEVDSATRRSYNRNQVQQLANLVAMTPLFGGALPFQGGWHGLGILSKFPIIASDKLLLPNPDSTVQRILLQAYIELPDGRTIRFCTTQLDPKSPFNRGLQMATVKKTLAPSIQPVILTGDFNTDPFDPIVLKMKEEWDDAGEDAQLPTLVGTGARIDYVATKKEQELELVRYRVLNEPNTSDHLPVLATYRFKKAK